MVLLLGVLLLLAVVLLIFLLLLLVLFLLLLLLLRERQVCLGVLIRRVALECRGVALDRSFEVILPKAGVSLVVERARFQAWVARRARECFLGLGEPTRLVQGAPQI